MDKETKEFLDNEAREEHIMVAQLAAFAWAAHDYFMQNTTPQQRADHGYDGPGFWSTECMAGLYDDEADAASWGRATAKKAIEEGPEEEDACAAALAEWRKSR